MGYIRFTDSDKQNILLCPHCYERTRHIQVSLSETFSSDPKASDTMKNVGRIIGGMSDIIGTAPIARFIGNHYTWKCTECGTITIRKRDGQISRIFDEFE